MHAGCSIAFPPKGQLPLCTCLDPSRVWVHLGWGLLQQNKRDAVGIAVHPCCSRSFLGFLLSAVCSLASLSPCYQKHHHHLPPCTGTGGRDFSAPVPLALLLCWADYSRELPPHGAHAVMTVLHIGSLFSPGYSYSVAQEEIEAQRSKCT